MSDNGHPKSPAIHAKDASPVNGQIPPIEHRWKPGESGNISGKPRAAAWTFREWTNYLSDMTSEQWEEIAENKKAPGMKRIAAMQLLDTIGEARITAGNAVDRICDQTAGKPTQAIELSGPEGGPIENNVAIDYDKYANLFDEREGIAAANSHADSSGNGSPKPVHPQDN